MVAFVYNPNMATALLKCHTPIEYIPSIKLLVLNMLLL